MYITVQLYLLLFLIFCSLSCHLYTLLQFLIFVTIHVVIHYSCTCILCIQFIMFHVYPVDIVTASHITVIWLLCILHITCSYSSQHHYATVIIRLNKKYKVIKTCYMLLLHTDVIRTLNIVSYYVF